MSVVARFRVSQVEPPTHEGGQARVLLTAVYTANTDDPHYDEIRSFHEATPNGRLEMWINNIAAAEHFQVGDDYYINLERCPEGVPA